MLDFSGWTDWLLSEGPYRPCAHPPAPPKPQAASGPAPVDPGELEPEERPVTRQLIQLLRETLDGKFPEAFQAVLDAFAQQHQLGRPWRC